MIFLYLLRSEQLTSLKLQPDVGCIRETSGTTFKSSNFVPKSWWNNGLLSLSRKRVALRKKSTKYLADCVNIL